VTNLHTVGLRGAGAIAGFNFEAEVAYQFGNADTVGQTTNWAGLKSPYGDDDAEFGKFGANAMLGYTFDFTCAPHLFVGGAYFGGEDNRDLSFGQWLGAIACPFWNQKASVSFNRMFSDWQYGQFVSCMDHEDTNLWVAYAGVSGKVLDNLTLTLTGAYVETLEAYRTTWPIWSILGRRVTPLFPFTFIDKPTPKPMCWEADLSVKYQYTEDLSFELGYSHMFLLEGAAQGNYVIENGISFIGGTAGDDSDYIFLETKLSF
jgi:hypothetical protein